MCVIWHMSSSYAVQRVPNRNGTVVVIDSSVSDPWHRYLNRNMVFIFMLNIASILQLLSSIRFHFFLLFALPHLDMFFFVLFPIGLYIRHNALPISSSNSQVQTLPPSVAPPSSLSLSFLTLERCIPDFYGFSKHTTHPVDLTANTAKNAP